MFDIIGLMIGVYINARMLQGMFRVGENQDRIGIRILFSITALINACLIAMLLHSSAEFGREMSGFGSSAKASTTAATTAIAPPAPKPKVEVPKYASGKCHNGTGVDTTIQGVGYCAVEDYTGSIPCYLIDVTMKNHSSQIIDYCATDFVIQDSEGFKYKARRSLQSDVTRSLGTSESLAPDAAIRGYVAFDGIPTGSVIVSAIAQSNDVPYGIWDISGDQ